jgi:hypothetical protein
VRFRALGLLVAALALWSGSPARATPPSAASVPAANSGNTRLLSCGDFFKSAELTQLGLDASRYKEDAAQPSPDLGVRCRFGQVNAVIFRRSQLTNLADDEKLAKNTRVTFKLSEGPKLGSESRWSLIAGLDTLSFVSSNKHFACVASSRDRALLLKLAQALDSKMGRL